jgi:hypothetical protein
VRGSWRSESLHVPTTPQGRSYGDLANAAGPSTNHLISGRSPSIRTPTGSRLHRMWGGNVDIGATKPKGSPFNEAVD